MPIHPKITAAAVAGAVYIVVMEVLDMLGYSPSAEFQSAIGILLTLAAGWLMPGGAKGVLVDAGVDSPK